MALLLRGVRATRQGVLVQAVEISCDSVCLEAAGKGGE